MREGGRREGGRKGRRDWKPGKDNKADYYTKHFPGKYHQEVRPVYLHESANACLFLLHHQHLQPQQSTKSDCEGVLTSSPQPESSPGLSQHSLNPVQYRSDMGPLNPDTHSRLNAHTPDQKLTLRAKDVKAVTFCQIEPTNHGE